MHEETLSAAQDPSKFIIARMTMNNSAGEKIFSCDNVPMIVTDGCFISNTSGQGSEGIISLVHIIVIPVDRIFGSDILAGNEESSSVLSNFVTLLENFTQGKQLADINVEHNYIQDGKLEIKKQKKLEGKVQIVGVQHSSEFLTLGIQCITVKEGRQVLSADKKSQGNEVSIINKPSQSSHPSLVSAMPSGTEFYEKITQRISNIIKYTDGSDLSNVTYLTINDGKDNIVVEKKIRMFQWEATCGYGSVGEGESLDIKYGAIVLSKEDVGGDFALKNLFSTQAPIQFKMEKKIKQNNELKTIASVEFDNSLIKMYKQDGSHFMIITQVSSILVMQYLIGDNKNISGKCVAKIDQS